MIEIKFGQKLWCHSFKISTFWYQSRDHFKNVDGSTSSLIFTKFHLLANKRHLKRNSLKSKVQIKLEKKYEITSSKYYCIISDLIIKKILAGVLPVCCLLKLNFRKRKGPKVWTPWNRWFKLNWDKC